MDGNCSHPEISPPCLTYGHVYHYLVESISNLFVSRSDDDEAEGINCQDTVTAKPLKKGRGLVKSGFVENIQDNNIGVYIFCGDMFITQ